jgi:hypothetical protein
MLQLVEQSTHGWFNRLLEVLLRLPPEHHGLLELQEIEQLNISFIHLL